jgi:hypothetical protein
MGYDAYLKDQKVPCFDKNVDILQLLVIIGIQHNFSVDLVLADTGHVHTMYVV